VKVNPTRRGNIEQARSKNRQNAVEATVRDVTVRPTIIDVARLAKVSPATVSNTLHERPNVDDKTRKRVLAAVRKLSYTPNLRARRLRTGRADTIAIFSSMSFAISGGRARLGFTMEIAAAAAVRALESGIALVLVPPSVSGDSAFRDLHIDGALVVEPMKGDPEVVFLRQRGVPIVSIGRYPGKEVIPHVDIKPYQVARLLTDHLYEQNARSIALIVGAQPRYTHLETERSYRDFASTHAMPAIVRHADESGGEQAGYGAAIDLLTSHPELDGLLVSVDAFAAGARRAAVDMNRTVPHDLKIVTRYDGFHARESDPPLTAVNLHLDQLATLGVDLLLDHIGGRTDRLSVDGPDAALVKRPSSAI
jgi:DNA-binding LacI/PurR family transcriptional regulator